MKLFKSISRRLITSHPRSGRFVSLLVLSGVLSGAVAMVTLVVAIVADSYFHWSYRERINTLTMFIFIPSACVCIISFAIAIATQVLRRWLQGGALRWVAAGVGVGGLAGVGLLLSTPLQKVRATSQDKAVLAPS